MAAIVPCMQREMPPKKPERQPEMALIKDCKQFAILAQMFDKHDIMAPMAAYVEEHCLSYKRQQLRV